MKHGLKKATNYGMILPDACGMEEVVIGMFCTGDKGLYMWCKRCRSYIDRVQFNGSVNPPVNTTAGGCCPHYDGHQYMHERQLIIDEWYKDDKDSDTDKDDKDDDADNDDAKGRHRQLGRSRGSSTTSHHQHDAKGQHRQLGRSHGSSTTSHQHDAKARHRQLGRSSASSDEEPLKKVARLKQTRFDEEVVDCLDEDYLHVPECCRGFTNAPDKGMIRKAIAKAKNYGFPTRDEDDAVKVGFFYDKDKGLYMWCTSCKKWIDRVTFNMNLGLNDTSGGYCPHYNGHEEALQRQQMLHDLDDASDDQVWQ